jgi:predicted dehydrogenase
MKRNILIVGAGQLGSRHIQGVLKVKTSINLFVVDPCDESLLIAKQRAEEINHNHPVKYLTGWTELPKDFDIVILATSSNVREKIIFQLTKNYTTKYLILEKVLFPEVESYKRIKELLENHKIKTWVNHPRRMFQSYRNLKKEMSSNPKVFQVTGGNWGLGCNGLHFIDLFAFLASSNVKSIDTSGVDNMVTSSKRIGFIEFSGTITGIMDNGSIFQITSFFGESTANTITIFDVQNRYIIQESGTPAIFSLRNDKNFTCEEKLFIMEYQSSLTTELVNSLIETGNCLLPDYEEACNCHLPFIIQLLNKYNQSTNTLHSILPIT